MSAQLLLSHSGTGNNIELDMNRVMRPLSRRIRNKERLWIFRSKLVKLYDDFEAKLEDLCKEHKVEINLWYSPSKIPQPKFRFGSTVIDADMLYNDDEFSLIFSPKISLDMGGKTDKQTLEKSKFPNTNAQSLKS